LNEDSDGKCRLCKQHEETTARLTSGCPIFAKNEYDDTKKLVDILIISMQSTGYKNDRK